MDGDEVGALQPLQPVGHVEAQAVQEVDRPLRVFSAGAEVEGGNPVGGPVEPEHLVDHPELEGGGLIGQQNGDGSKDHANHDDTVGRKFTNNV